MTEWSVPHAQSLVVSQNQGMERDTLTGSANSAEPSSVITQNHIQKSLELEPRKLVACAKGLASRIEHTGIVKRSASVVSDSPASGMQSHPH